jgi:uncharacterized protein (DUF433 family)
MAGVAVNVFAKPAGGRYHSVMATTVDAPHIVRDAHGVAWVDDTNVKVVEIALDHLAYGWSPEAIHEQFPHLSLAQILSALAFFYDHQSEFEVEMARREHEVSGWRAELGESPLQRRLRQLKASR